MAQRKPVAGARPLARRARTARGVQIAALATGLAALSSGAWAAPDLRDARIDQLEAQVRQLIADHQQQAAKDEALAARADALAVEVDALKRAQAPPIQTIAAAEGRAPAPPPAVTTLANGRPIFSSADGQFTTTLRTVMQLDTAAYDQASAGPLAADLRRSGPALGATAANVDLTHARALKSGTDFRRARLGVDGTAFGDWDYRFLLDFGGTGVEDSGQLYETWVQYSGLRPLRLRVGAFSPSIGLDDQASTNGMAFLERAAVEDIARGFAAGDTRIAAQAYAAGDHWLVSGAVTGRVVGVVNTGTAAATPQTFGDQLALVGRAAGSPFHGDDWRLLVGVHGSYVARPANTSGPGPTGATPLTGGVVSFGNTPELRVDGTRLVNTGNIDARRADTAGLEFALQKAGLLLTSEYETFGVQRTDPGLSNPHFHGFYVAGTWVLTGEARRYNVQTAAFDAPPVNHPFSLSRGGWGAWEVGLRYSDLDLNAQPGAPGTAPSANAIRGGAEQNLTAALNWYPNGLVRFMLDYDHVHIDRLSPNAALYQTPVGAQIGQTYNAFAVRTQFAF
jgi:phosphate-selective porin OprO/OprP